MELTPSLLPTGLVFPLSKVTSSTAVHFIGVSAAKQEISACCRHFLPNGRGIPRMRCILLLFLQITTGGANSLFATDKWD